MKCSMVCSHLFQCPLAHQGMLLMCTLCVPNDWFLVSPACERESRLCSLWLPPLDTMSPLLQFDVVQIVLWHRVEGNPIE